MNNRQSLTFRLALALAIAFLNLAFFASSASAKNEWIQVRSKNFNLIGNASEKDIRKVATRLEQFRETFRRLFTSVKMTSPIPTNVIVFKDSSSYKPFKPKRADGKTDNWIAGYFQAGEDVNYITLSTEGDDTETYGTIFHEYVHFLVNTNYGKSEVPPWFNEGLAEYYQTFQIEKDQAVKLGIFQQSHLDLLQQSELIPLETLFKISNYSLHQNGSHSRSIFYAQSWALIHYLVQSGKSEGLGKFLGFLLQNVPAEKAFQDAFQSTYAQMEKDLRKYVKQSSYKYLMVTFKEKILFDNEIQSSPLTDAAANAYFGDLLYHTDRADDAEAYLQKALAAEPHSSMANTTMGMVKLRQRKFADAKNFLEKAISDDQKNHLAFYNYAYLLSREDRDEFGYVSAFAPEKSRKMREMLKRAIAVNPSYTQSYELLAFVNLVNREQLDEAVALLQQALRYQPGNQRYAIRIAEIYLRQDKFDEARQILEKIARTADEPETKAQAERLAGQVQQAQEILARNEAARRQYETSGGAPTSSAAGGGGRPAMTRREVVAGGGGNPSPEEIARIEAETKIYWINQQLRKPAANEKQLIGQLLKIDCKKGTILYTVKENDKAETFTLASKDFEGLTLTAYVADAESARIGCGAKAEDFNAVLTYKVSASDAGKSSHRGELVTIDFVPKSFRFMDTSQPPPTLNQATTAGENYSGEVSASNQPPASAPANQQDFEAGRREAMMEGLRRALRQPLEGEKRDLGFVEKIECSGSNMFFHFKIGTQIIKLTAASPQSIQLRAFTPDIGQISFGCGLKQIDIPAVITYKADSSPKAKTAGELVALEFVPKSFVLEK